MFVTIASRSGRQVVGFEPLGFLRCGCSIEQAGETVAVESGVIVAIALLVLGALAFPEAENVLGYFARLVVQRAGRIATDQRSQVGLDFDVSVGEL